MALVWFCKISEEQLGPFSSRQIKELVAEGRLSPGDHVRQGTDGPWQRAGEVRGLFPHEGSVAKVSDSQGLPVARPLQPSPPPPPKAKKAPPPKPDKKKKKVVVKKKKRR